MSLKRLVPHSSLDEPLHWQHELQWSLMVVDPDSPFNSLLEEVTAISSRVVCDCQMILSLTLTHLEFLFSEPLSVILCTATLTGRDFL